MTRPSLPTILLNLAGALLLGMVGALYLLLDKLAAVSLYPVAVACFVALGIVASLPLLHGRRRAIQAAIPLLIVLLALAVQPINWDSRKPFLRALNRVEIGMTVEQVDDLMTGYMRTPAQSGTLGNTSTIAFRHTDAGWGNSDIGLVAFANGRVTSREYPPD
ncbi:MAG: hypothetical protein U0232_15085 [Thermomicrobiales bacterium]